MNDWFDRASRSLAELDGADARITAPILEAVPVTGAAISTMGFLGSQTIAASDDQAARLDELQFDLGEGPCWDALSTGLPVLEPAFRTEPQHEWPAFIAATQDDDIGAIFAFPLLIGPLRMGAMDLYDTEAREIRADELHRAAAFAGLVSRFVLRRALRDATDEQRVDTERPFSRRLIHQATGFVIAQLGISADDALLLLQGQAYAEGRPVLEIAESIVNRERGFTTNADSIEDLP